MKTKVQLNAFPAPELRLKCWNELYHREGQRWGSIPSMTANLALPELERLNNEGPGVRLLELGCGYGRDLALFRAVFPGIMLDALEGSPVAVEQGRGSLPWLKLSHLFSEDVLEFSGRGVLYDIVYGNYFVHLFDAHEVELILGTVRGCLRPGGAAIFSLVSKLDPNFGKGNRLDVSSFEVAPGIPWTFYEPEEVADLFGRTGFVPKEVRRFSEIELIRGEPDRVEGIFAVAEKF